MICYGRSSRATLIAIAIVVVACNERRPPPEQTSGPPRAEWRYHGGTPNEERFSPLAQINRDTIARLGLAWSYELRTDRGVEATPLVVDGVMYVTGAWSIVYALDAATGEELWVHDPQVPKIWGQKVCCDVVNRGVAFDAGKVFLGTLDGRLLALNAADGRVIWETLTVDQSQPYSITGAPRTANNKVYIGNGGADYGVRGYVSAYDVNSGELVWRFYTVPGDPSRARDGAASDRPLREIARPTWTGEWWRFGGGGTVWDAIVFDPSTNFLIFGVGNGSPHDRNIRSPEGGDNLFLSSIVAVDADSGEYRWHYQTTPGDTWDFTATQQIVLADVVVHGDLRKVLWQAPKNGFFYMLDRTNGELISAEPYTGVTWATHVDPRTGRPQETENARYESGTAMLKPAVFGGHNWQPMSYSPQTGLVYIPAIDTATPRSVDPAYRYIPGWWNTGNPGPAFPPDPEILSQIKASARSYLRAWDPVKQRAVWDAELVGPWNGGVLSTAGGLVFQGTADGRLVAYDALSGKKLWQHETGTATLAGPIAYAIDGEQYVAVPGGFGSIVFLALGVLMPEAVPDQNGRVFVYKLDGSARLPEPVVPATVFPTPPPIEATEEQLAYGRDLYGYFCWQCHGANAISSGVIPDLRRSGYLQSDPSWRAVVRDGALSAQGMGPFGDWLTDADAEAIRQFVIAEATRLQATTR
ncbi:MAG: PQQ-dependent dehydrogenase, methanol/ethanol family [Pseudomonadota bacterium]